MEDKGWVCSRFQRTGKYVETLDSFVQIKDLKTTHFHPLFSSLLISTLLLKRNLSSILFLLPFSLILVVSDLDPLKKFSYLSIRVLFFQILHYTLYITLFNSFTSTITFNTYKVENNSFNQFRLLILTLMSTGNFWLNLTYPGDYCT